MAEEKNTVFVELYDLAITERGDDRFGKVITSRSMNIDDLIKIAVARRTDLNPTTLKAAAEILDEVALECILKGDSVHYGLGYHRLDVKGIFLGDNASWDSRQHRLIPSITPVSILREGANSASVKVRGMASVGTFINSVTDVTSGEVNAILTPGGGVNVTGSKIKIAGDYLSNGLYLENMEGAIFQIPMTSILINDPSKLSFIVPVDIAHGDYKLRVVTQFTTSSNILKEPRTYIFEYPLTII
jgi:hypothetical protein